MATYKIPQTDFVPHPEGQHEGFIQDVQDKKEVETSFGLKHKIAVIIVSTTAIMNEDHEEKGYQIQKWFTLSGHPKSDLRKFRETMAGRKLVDAEAYDFNTEELEGRGVGYIVVHNTSEGRTYANTTNIWPLKESVRNEVSPKAQTLGQPNIQVEYFLRLVDLQVDNKLIEPGKMEKAANWAKDPKTNPQMLETVIREFEEKLTKAKIALPEQPDPEKPKNEDDLPF